jgi:exodeoxyribonuclease VII small subunit
MSAKKQASFEKSLEELEAITAKLESDNCSLESAVENFEKGVSLLRGCQAQLDQAKGKISDLLKGEQGKFIEKELGLTADFLGDGNPSDE